jgi:RNA polymerase sigma factor (sigma-70 family)
MGPSHLAEPVERTEARPDLRHTLTAAKITNPAQTQGLAMCAQQTATDIPSAALNIAELAYQYTGLLRSIGRQYRLTREEQEDAAQSTWLALCQNAEQIRDPQRIPGWLATTMRRFSAAAIHRRHREPPASDWIDNFAAADLAPEVPDAVASKQATLRLHEAITQLPERERRLIQLQFGPTQQGYAQISRTMQMPIGSIGPIRGRALRRLRTLLHDLE